MSATSKTKVLTAGEAVVDGLVRNGIDTLFCLPGIQNDLFFDALHGRTDEIRPVHTRHEQAAAYMALGSALATGKPSAFCVVPGPGFLNASTALATAYSMNAKVLALLGQIPLATIDRGYGLLHEIRDQLSILRSMTKWAERIKAPAEAARLTQEAFRQLGAGRPRPVGLECPMDVWGARAPVVLPGGPAETDAIPIDTDKVEEAAKLLGSAKNPMIVVGGGALDASEEVRQIAEMLEAPVCAFRMGRGVLDSRHHLSLTMPTGYRLWKDVDVVLGIGTRMQPHQQFWGTDSGLKIIRIDLCPEELARIRRPDIGIVGNAAPVLRALADAVPKHNAKRTSRKDELDEARAKTMEMFDVLRPQLDYVDAIRDALPEDGIFVDELTQVSYVSRFAMPVYTPRSFIPSGYQGTLGWGFAAGLGVKVGKPDRPVLSVNGDGGFMFSVQEMATAVRHRINLVSVVFNDGAFGNVQRIQKLSYGNRTIASDLTNPDFCKLAESFGVAGLRATTPDALRARIEEGFKMDAPVLIEVPVGEMPDPWSLLMQPKVRG
ncbi:MAG: thiamine pyrophosphate-binding protein [Rhodospirillales bacterium]|jgi:acetolactate synthase-1/2/3 large subunit|nr:thiamine pyrophosphate-binding protein [Rhodospirillales bacterium]